MTEYITNKLKLAVLGGLAGAAGGAVANRKNMKFNQGQIRSANARAKMAADAAYDRLIKANKARRDAMNFGIGAERVESMPTLSGRGKYKIGRQILNGIGTGVGGVAGGLGAGLLTTNPYAAGAGLALGSSFGGDLGDSIADIVGMGKYEVVKKNSIATSGAIVPEGYDVPAFAASNHGTRIRHREFVSDVVVPSSPLLFSNTTYSINPGNSSLFPWLANVAAQYQQYEFNGLVLMFKTLSSDITSGGALGSVVMATNYDVLEAPFANKIAMENSQYAVSCKPSLSQIHAIECDPEQSVTKLKYVRSLNSSATSSQDNRFYDHGRFQVATVGLPGSAGAVLGELWATYDITLYKPEVGVLVATQHVTSSVGVSNASFFGTTPVVTGTNLFAPSGNSLVFSTAGSFVVEFDFTGVALAFPLLTGSTGVNVTDSNSSNPRVAITNLLGTCVVDIPVGGGTLNINVSASTSVATSTINCTNVNNSVWSSV